MPVGLLQVNLGHELRVTSVSDDVVGSENVIVCRNNIRVDGARVINGNPKGTVRFVEYIYRRVPFRFAIFHRFNDVIFQTFADFSADLILLRNWNRSEWCTNRDFSSLELDLMFIRVGSAHCIGEDCGK